MKENDVDYKFSKDWFSWAPEIWGQLVPLMPERKRFLEIGSFEGRSTVWTMEHLMADDSSVVCIDTWEGGEEHVNGEMAEAEQNFDHNIALAKGKFPNRAVYKCKKNSYYGLTAQAEYIKGLANKDGKDRRFDFVYIDGSHIAKDVLTDACLAWPLLKPNGIMVFDDYAWGQPRDALHRPKIAIDAFTNIFGEELVVIHTHYQLIVRKIV